MICETAPAKINLYLHVGGVRADGLHDLASLFVFAERGDEVCAATADRLTLAIEGPFASALAGFPIEDNLVLKAATALRDHAGVRAGAALKLVKNLPVAAGIGGGSADAAAALRALVRLWDISISEDALAALAFRLGADIPACLSRGPILVDGAGEILNAAPALPPLHVCLVNPLVETPTGPVFRAFDGANPAPPAPVHPSASGGFAALMEKSRNDLQEAAIAHAPVIADVLACLAPAEGLIAARMSGSGATCFGLFESAEQADGACESARKKGWWALASALASG